MNYKKIYPAKLKRGDKIAVIAPSKSFSILSPTIIKIANQRFNELGLEVVFGKHLNECDEFNSSSVQSRVDDLHWAFSDSSIKGIFCALGGFNCNQLLQYIDWNLIKNNPKIFCGYSDITALQNAILAKTGLVTYSGRNYSGFGQLINFEYTFNYTRKCFFDDSPIEVLSSTVWSDDAWHLYQQNCNLIQNEGMYSIVQGQSLGTIIGGNLITLQALQGTEYFPNLQDSILFLEDDYELKPHHFDRALQSLCLLPDFKHVKGLVIGRSQKVSGITKELLHKIVTTKKELLSIPVIAGVDFGHTSPMITFPIGGQVSIDAGQHGVKIVIIKH